MTEKLAPGDQVELTCSCHPGEYATVEDTRGAPFINIMVHELGGTLWSTGAHETELRLIARCADLVAEPDYLATDTIDATQEAIDRVRASEREGEKVPPTHVQVLNEAADLLVGQRQVDYGEPVENLGKIASLWSVAFNYGFSAEDVALAMVLLKVARAANTYTRDSAVDMAGYAALYAAAGERS